MQHGKKRFPIYVIKYDFDTQGAPQEFQQGHSSHPGTGSQFWPGNHLCSLYINFTLSLQITSIFGPTKVRVLRGSYSWVGVMRIILYYFAVLSFLLLTVFLWKVATKMDLVFLPSTGELRMWWVMST